MKAVVQRAVDAVVTADGAVTGKITHGLLIYIGICDSDDEIICMKMADKLSKLRIFRDENGKMNKSVSDVNGQIMVISQFTLFADIRQGNRPYFGNAGNPEKARKLYEVFVNDLKSLGYTVQCGVFGAHMHVKYENDGPVTIIADSDELFLNKDR